MRGLAIASRYVIERPLFDAARHELAPLCTPQSGWQIDRQLFLLMTNEMISRAFTDLVHVAREVIGPDTRHRPARTKRGRASTTAGSADDERYHFLKFKAFRLHSTPRGTTLGRA